MSSRLIVILFAAGPAFAQTPNFSGVWKAVPEQSKFIGPPPSSYLAVIDQHDSSLSETIGAVGRRGEERSSFTYDLSGKPSMNAFHGIPMRTVSSLDAGALKLSSKIAAAKPGSLTETFTLSPDGNTLTIQSSNTSGDHTTEQTLVLQKQPDSAGDALRKPEQTAGARFKNVQLLKNLPASQFIDTMRYFTMALGGECDLCHTQGDFAADTKPNKLMARKMIEMNEHVNEMTFGGKMVVRCYTCHQGHAEPQNHPAFE
jgi:hypothetical protein